MPPSQARFKPLPALASVSACVLALAAFAAWRYWLFALGNEPLLSPGVALFILLLGCLGWLAAEPPQVSAGGAMRLAWVAAALLLLSSGGIMLWLRGNPKMAYAWPGYACLLSGAALLCAALPPAPARPGSHLPGLKLEWALLAAVLLGALLLRFHKLGSIPSTWWYDEINLARATQDHVVEAGDLPVYVTENVENPGMYLWIAGLAFKLFGVGVTQLRELSAFFGWLSLLPFYFLARRLLGGAWGLAALALFAAMRWTLIPQHIGFMSGFAIFWTLTAVYFYWRCLGTRRIADFALAGLSLGFTLHCYTPTRLVLPMLLAFSLWHWRLFKGLGWKPWAALSLGFLAVAGPMLLYIAGHWSAYALRAHQVSIMNDIHAKGWGELWISFSKHLGSFHYRGDFNGRHNLYFWPQLDYLSGLIFAPALLWAHWRAAKDARAALFSLWFWIMLSAGILSMTVEAPQAHRSILVAPLTALCSAWFLSEAATRLESVWKDGWPASLKIALLGLLTAVPLFNAYELYANWPEASSTWRSFSPESTLAARRAAESPQDWEVYVSPLANEYQFHGFERDQFVRFALKQQGRGFYPLRLSQQVGQGSGPEPKGVLVIWGDSDPEISAAMRRDFPQITVEEARDPFEAKNDYLAAAIPWEAIPSLKASKSKQPFFFRP